VKFEAESWEEVLGNGTASYRGSGAGAAM